MEDSRLPFYLFVGVVIGIYVVVKLLMFLVLLITEFTVKVGSKIFKGLGNCLFFVHIILQ